MMPTTITESDIRDRLLNQYGGDTTRDLVKHERTDGHGDAVGSVVYSLAGSPPKGYAIAIPELRLVNFYDHHGKRVRKLTETVVES